jgi:glutamate carboxypeptidase
VGHYPAHFTTNRPAAAPATPTLAAVSDRWVASAAAAIAARAERELEALVAVSSPSGDRRGAEEAVAVATALLPAEASVERPECSSPDHAPDLLARLSGTGSRRVLLLGHLDTVVAHAEHRPLERHGDRLYGSGTADMKGGVVLALGALRGLAERPDAYAEAALLLVVDEEWRTRPFHHAGRFAGWDACLCFEAGQQGAGGEEGVVVKRKAAGTLKVTASGAAAHSGSAPDRGRNALLALAAAAQRVAERHEPDGPERLTAVPTILHSGEAFNVVPAAGELFCDLRADRAEAFGPVVSAVPDEVGGAQLAAELVRVWPGMDARDATDPLLSEASKRLGRPVAAMERGGASDASHVASVVPLTVDGLGPRGGGAHSPGEFIRADSIEPRAAVALAVLAAALDI